MTALAGLTPVQAAAVIATAEAHLRDAEELAAELADLLTAPDPEPLPAPLPLPPPTPAWRLVGTTESGSGVWVRPLPMADSAVNDPLTSPIPVQEAAP